MDRRKTLGRHPGVLLPRLKARSGARLPAHRVGSAKGVDAEDGPEFGLRLGPGGERSVSSTESHVRLLIRSTSEHGPPETPRASRFDDAG